MERRSSILGSSMFLRARRPPCLFLEEGAEEPEDSLKARTGRAEAREAVPEKREREEEEVEKESCCFFEKVELDEKALDRKRRRRKKDACCSFFSALSFAIARLTDAAGRGGGAEGGGAVGWEGE